MEQHLLDAVSKMTTPQIVLVLVGYAIGKLTQFLIHVMRSRYRAKIMRLELENAQLRKELELARSKDAPVGTLPM